jgi:DNA-binding transcriptional LysR family regulator
MDRDRDLGAGQGSGASDRVESSVSLERKLAAIDLNLLIALEALLTCRNVTHAARRIGQTQPAVSRALARLREILNDDLLVRSSTGQRLTKRGEYLAQILPAAMSHVRDVISARHANFSARVTVSAYLMPALLPHLMQTPARRNQPLKVDAHKFPKDGIAQLRLGTAQLMLGAVAEKIDNIEHIKVFSEDFVTLVAFERHELGGARPPRDLFLELEHVNLIDNRAELFPQFAESLAVHGVRRSDLVEVPDVTSAALMVSESRLAMTVPRSTAGWLTKTLPLAAVLPPIDIPQHEVAVSWLAGEPDVGWRQLVDDIGAATKAAMTKDQASVRIVRPISSEA